jgi:hypothetical protein
MKPEYNILTLIVPTVSHARPYVRIIVIHHRDGRRVEKWMPLRSNSRKRLEHFSWSSTFDDSFKKSWNLKPDQLEAYIWRKGDQS